ncbi:hypothetical protein GLOIN_2v1579710, partial [Rhizophagus irregularis DAOM 181602=DAOM 197198]
NYQNISNEILQQEANNDLERNKLINKVANYLQVKFINLKIYLNQKMQQKVYFNHFI